jgi:hypothetical protein
VGDHHQSATTIKKKKKKKKKSQSASQSASPKVKDFKINLGMAENSRLRQEHF